MSLKLTDFGLNSSVKTMEDLIVPTKDPVGVKLLRLMGWREGRGIGAKRVRSKVKTEKEVEKEGKSNNYTSYHQVEPKRVMGPIVPVELRKIVPDEKPNEIDELFAGETSKEEEEELISPEFTKPVEFPNKSDTYGIGYDPFTTAPEFRGKNITTSKFREGTMSLSSAGPSRTRDFGLGALEEDDEDEVYTHDTMEGYDFVLGDEKETEEQPKVMEKKSSVKIPVATSDKRCSDGSLPLKGFTLSSKLVQAPVWFKAPKPPRGWTPSPILEPDTGNLDHASNIDPRIRGEILGEKPLPGLPRIANSVFALLSPEDRERLNSFSNRFTSAKEEEKAEMTEWQKQQAAKVFEQSSEKFKRLGDAMASKFIRQGEQPKKEDDEYKTEAYQETAAAMNMIGKLTRRKESWYPAGLVCKRFNVRNPHLGKKKPEKPRKQLGDVLQTADLPPAEVLAAESQKEVEKIPPPTEDDDADLPPLPERPPMDLFKAIFEESDDEEEQETKDANQKKEVPTKVELVPIQSEVKVENSTPVLHPHPLQVPSVPQVEPTVTLPQLPSGFTADEKNPYVYFPPKRDARGGIQSDVNSESGKKRSLEVIDLVSNDQPNRERGRERESDRDRHRSRDRDRDRNGSRDRDRNRDRDRDRDRKYKQEKKHRRERDRDRSYDKESKRHRREY